MLLMADGGAHQHPADLIEPPAPLLGCWLAGQLDGRGSALPPGTGSPATMDGGGGAGSPATGQTPPRWRAAIGN